MKLSRIRKVQHFGTFIVHQRSMFNALKEVITQRGLPRYLAVTDIVILLYFAVMRDNIHYLLKLHNFTEIHSTSNKIISELLLQYVSFSPLSIESTTSNSGYIYHDKERVIAVFDDRINTFFIPKEGKSIQQILQTEVWKVANAQELILSQNKNTEHNADYNVYSLIPMPAADASSPYESNINPEDIANRLRKLTANNPSRSLLLVGLSGVGKSIFARKVAAELFGPAYKLLKIPNRLILKLGGSIILELLHTLNPDVLLLDDVPLQEGKYKGDFLEVFEMLRTWKGLVFSTVMTDRVSEQGFYYEGMRPGRIDETIYIPPPDQILRAKILISYTTPPELAHKIAALTEGLTAAYLKEIAIRIQILGSEHWEQEVQSVLLTSPQHKSATIDSDITPVIMANPLTMP